MRGGAGSEDSIAAFVDGDPQAAAVLRQSLVALHARLAGDPELADVRRQVGEVLAGAMTMRELAAVPAVRAMADQGMDTVHEAWLALDADARGRLGPRSQAR